MIKSICFVGFDNYPLLTASKSPVYIGGESVQQNLLARAFAQLGCQVSFVDKDYGQPNGQVIGNIKVWKTYHETDGIPVVRFLYPRITSIMRALRRANAQVYYQSCSGALTGLVSRFCNRHSRKFIFRTAHDTDCIRGRQMIRYWRDRKMYEYGLKRAHIIAVQGLNQKALLKKNYNLEGTPVNMTVEIPNVDTSSPRNIDVLWVNNMRSFKRPDLTIQLGKLLPSYEFVMIGGPAPGLHSYYESIKAKTRNIRNLHFVGPVTYYEVNDYFSKAKVFINTSTIEGFPNSFLQAWARSVPVISFFDPDGLITNNDLGSVPLNLHDMAETVDRLLACEDKRAELGQRAKRFVMNQYSPALAARKYIKLLDALE